MKIIKIIQKIILLIIMLQLLCIPNVQATSYWGDIIEAGDDFINIGKNEAQNSQGSVDDRAKMQNSVDFIYNTFLAIGIAGSVIVGLILGIKYMIESVEEQAKIKETLIAYAVGCAVTFGAFGIWKIVIEIFKQL